MKNTVRTISSLFYQNYFWIPIILIISIYFRIFSLDLIEYKADEALSVFQVGQFFQQPYLIKTGLVSSTGIYNFPLFHYILLILGLFSKQPQYLSFLIALLNCCAIVGFYLIAKKYYGNTAAIISSLLIATSPWSILFSRKIWAQDLIFPFVIILLFFLNKLVLENKKAYSFWVFLCLTFLSQLHGSGLFFTLITLGILFFTKTNIDFIKVVKGIGVGLITALPFIYYELTSIPFCRDYAAFIKYQKLIRPFDFLTFVRPFQIINNGFFNFELGNDWQQFISIFPIINWLTYFSYIEIVLVFIGFSILLKQKKKIVYFLFYPICLPFLYFLTRTPSYPHYYAIVLPFLFLAIGFTFSVLLENSRNKIIKISLISLAFIFFISNIIFEICFTSFLRIKNDIQGDYGPVFSLTNKLVNQKTDNYKLNPNYEEIKRYAYIFAQSDSIHSELANYFVKTNQPILAINEFTKALEYNKQDVFSLANITYIYIQTGDFKTAEEKLNLLSSQESTMSSQLRVILEKKKATSLTKPQ